MTRNNGILTNFCAIHNGGVNSNQAPITDIATMEGGVVGDRAILTNDGRRRDPDVNHDEVLNIGARTDANLERFRTGYHVWPD